MRRVPIAGSEAEAELLLHLRAAQLPPPERELAFAAMYDRNWRFDLAWSAVGLAVEVEGAPHRIKERFRSDLEKYLVAALLGWRVLRFSPAQIRSGLAILMLEALLGPIPDVTTERAREEPTLVRFLRSQRAITALQEVGVLGVPKTHGKAGEGGPPNA